MLSQVGKQKRETMFSIGGETEIIRRSRAMSLIDRRTDRPSANASGAVNKELRCALIIEINESQCHISKDRKTGEM